MVSRNFYIAVTQQVLLFGADTWVLTKKMEAALDAFQGRVAGRLTGRMPRRVRDGKWLYLPLAEATKDAGIVRARTSVLRRQNTVAQFVVTRPILVLCEGTEQRGGGHGSPKDGGNSPESTGGWRGRRTKERRRREKQTQKHLQGRQWRHRRRRHQDRKMERGRRRHWGPVAPVGRNGAGWKIKTYSFSDNRRYTGISSS